MRFLNGVVIGFLLAVGLAYWHDRGLPADGEGLSRALVNWEVFGQLAAATLDWVHDQLGNLGDLLHHRG